MKSSKIHIVFLLPMIWLLYACATVPITGRSQLNIMPDSSMLSMSLQQYDTFLKDHKLSRDTLHTRMVKRVGARIQKAVELYFRQHNLYAQLQGYRWEFNLVESKEANAWCMPGGKVVVYTGILPLTRDENGLAVVMGHEIAHAVAKHGNERMSQQLAFQMGGVALATAVSQKPQQTQELWMQAYGMGSQMGVLLPYSRLQESEADHLGLIFMAMAGYDPGGAVTFWQRMAAKQQGKAPPEFLSTHPSDAIRIQQIRALLPEAMRYYRKAG
jgi:predicted Zn-dependent protease